MAAAAVAQPVDLKTGVDPKEEVGPWSCNYDRGLFKIIFLYVYQLETVICGRVALWDQTLFSAPSYCPAQLFGASRLSAGDRGLLFSDLI
jgi:hypothetical protein